MMLSEFQRKNPNRQISTSNYQTYLSRALNEGRLDEVDVYWKDGALLKALKKNARVHTNLAQGYLVLLSRGVTEEIKMWQCMWEGLQKEIPITDKEWSFSLANSHFPGSRILYTEIISEWIKKGANPFLQPLHSSECFFFRWWDPILNTSSNKPPSDELIQSILVLSQKWLQEASNQPQWFKHRDTASVLPTLMWRLCTKKESFPSSVWSHLKAWQELFTTQGVNPLQKQRGLSALNQVLSSYIAKPLDKINLCKDLLSGQFDSGSHPISAYDFVTILDLTSKFPGFLLKELARHNQFLWNAELAFFQKRAKENSLGLLSKHLQENPKDFNWEELLKSLEEIAKTNPPSSDWVAQAFKSWLDYQFSLASKEKKGEFHFEDLKPQWESWYQIGNWKIGLPDNIIQSVQSFMGQSELDIDYRILREGMVVLLSCPNAPQDLFGHFNENLYTQTWLIRGLFQIWEKILKDESF